MGASGERPGADNVHNSGGLRSVLFTRDGDAAPGAARGGWWPEGFLHEITHNLGAVQWAAPHSTAPAAAPEKSRYGHCWQGADVMCYVEDTGAAHGMQFDCPLIPGTITQGYDCGRDDYYNPAPAPDSYLASHWNIYDSAFMEACTRIAPACGGGELWVPAPPVVTEQPVVTGRARRGANDADQRRHLAQPARPVHAHLAAPDRPALEHRSPAPSPRLCPDHPRPRPSPARDRDRQERRRHHGLDIRADRTDRRRSHQPARPRTPIQPHRRSPMTTAITTNAWHRLDVHVDHVLARTHIAVIGALDSYAVAGVDRAIRTAKTRSHTLTLELAGVSSVSPPALTDLLNRR